MNEGRVTGVRVKSGERRVEIAAKTGRRRRRTPLDDPRAGRLSRAESGCADGHACGCASSSIPARPRRQLGWRADRTYARSARSRRLLAVRVYHRKGSFEGLKAQESARCSAGLAEIVPVLRERVGELDDWSKISMLDVRVDRLRRWHSPGLLCIGDSAHAMSPIGGIGINLAIQDAVAAANILCEPLPARRILRVKRTLRACKSGACFRPK